MADRTAAQSAPAADRPDTLHQEQTVTPEVQCLLDRLNAAFTFTPAEYDAFLKRVRFIRYLIATGKLSDDC